MKLFKIFIKNIHRSQRERGQSIVIVAIGMVTLIAFIGLATDATMIYKTKQDLQRTVDSAALAAAYKLPSPSNATKAAYEFADLHGYTYDPSDPVDPSVPYLEVSFPVYDPPRKVVRVTATTESSYFFLKILGVKTIMVSATGEAESAPIDVYLVFDLSESMTYDTYSTQRPSPKPSWWVYQSDEIAQWCNANRKCDPLDIHIKPAADFFVDQLDPEFDRVGVVSYDQQGFNIFPLSSDFNAVKDAINNLNAFDHQQDPPSSCPHTSPAGCNKNTNIGDGLMFAHNGIAAQGRMDAIWSIVLMTDGRANVYRSCSTCPSTPPPTPNCGASGCQTLHLCNECNEAETWAINNAIATWKFHETVIYTIAYGEMFFTDPSYRDLMIDIADWTDNGVLNGSTNDFWAVPDEAGLRTAFVEIAERIYARLLK
ncbi:MAG: pilus assembly protein TadG-related protein [Anaerolineales bacterium]